MAVKVTELPEHTGFAEAPIVTLTGRFGFTVMVTMLEVAGFPVAQVALDVRTQVTASLFTGTYVNEALFVPALIPFTFHWYAGVVPPLVGVAVKVTEIPEHTGFAEAPIDTLTGRFGFTVMVTVLDVAGLPVAQVALEVSMHVTASLFIGT